MIWRGALLKVLQYLGIKSIRLLPIAAKAQMGPLGIRHTHLANQSTILMRPVWSGRWTSRMTQHMGLTVGNLRTCFANVPTIAFITSSQIVLSFPNNKGYFNKDSITKFRINCRPQYPNRTFQTSSFYIANYYLPISSSYAIKDLDTNEFVVDFDDVYTRVSADSEGNYFKVFMNGLEPERYYCILVKTVLNGETQILDDNYYFKVKNG